MIAEKVREWFGVEEEPPAQITGSTDIKMLVSEIDKLIKRNEKQFISSPAAIFNPVLKEAIQNINLVLRTALRVYGGVKY